MVIKIGSDIVGFYYTAPLTELINDTKKISGGEFTLVKLESFLKLCIATADNGYLQPETLRARLGKLYNSAVRKDNFPCVERAKKR